MLPWKGQGQDRESRGRKSAPLCCLDSVRLLPPYALHVQLAARDVMVGEYLYVFRAGDLPLMGNEWELRYFVLSGQSLRQDPGSVWGVSGQVVSQRVVSPFSLFARFSSGSTKVPRTWCTILGRRPTLWLAMSSGWGRGIPWWPQGGKVNVIGT